MTLLIELVVPLIVALITALIVALNLLRLEKSKSDHYGGLYKNYYQVANAQIRSLHKKLNTTGSRILDQMKVALDATTKNRKLKEKLGCAIARNLELEEELSTTEKSRDSAEEDLDTATARIQELEQLLTEDIKEDQEAHARIKQLQNKLKGCEQVNAHLRMEYYKARGRAP